ncbi:MAG: Bug family tripartite tricarboxylate transporter substrate binding protein, partial [Burkholderiaceae bacterium]
LGVRAQDVPYRNFGQALTDAIGGQTDFILASLPITQSHIQAGTLRALAVGSPSRLPTLPNVPTLAEVMNVPGHEAVSWYGFVAPTGTPASVVSRLNDEIQKAIATPTVRTRIEQIGGRIDVLGPVDFTALVQAESERWSRLVKELNLSIE